MADNKVYYEISHDVTQGGANMKARGGWKEGLWTPDQVAHALGMSKPHVYNLAKNGDLPSIKFGRAVRFDPVDVETYIRAHRRGEVPPKDAA